jgi:hypothetical protein
MPDNGYQTQMHGVMGGSYRVLGTDTNGLPVAMFCGTAANDADIVTAVGLDTLWADGSLYVSAVDGAGKLFQKQNDVWIDLQV